MPVAMLQSMPQPLPENAPASAVELAAGTSTEEVVAKTGAPLILPEGEIPRF